MYDEFPGSSNGRKYGGEGDDSTINDEDEGVMRAGYTNNYGYGATEGAPPTDSEHERGNTPNHYPGSANKVLIFNIQYQYQQQYQYQYQYQYPGSANKVS